MGIEEFRVIAVRAHGTGNQGHEALEITIGAAYRQFLYLDRLDLVADIGAIGLESGRRCGYFDSLVYRPGLQREVNSNRAVHRNLDVRSNLFLKTWHFRGDGIGAGR